MISFVGRGPITPYQRRFRVRRAGCFIAKEIAVMYNAQLRRAAARLAGFIFCPSRIERSLFQSLFNAIPFLVSISKITLFQIMWTVYLLKCSDDGYYTGCTSDLDDRMRRHHAGEVPATQNRLPVRLVTYIVFSEKQKAYDFEKYLKTGSGRAVMYKHLV